MFQPEPRFFKNREDAGQRLARELSFRDDLTDAVVVALPRGGAPVAHEVAKELSLPIDILVVRKLGVPGHREYAMGAIAGDVTILNHQTIRQLGISQEAIDKVVQRERDELNRREKLYRGERAALDLEARTILLIDDGIATGSTVKAAIRILREMNAGSIILAVPTAPPDTADELRGLADEVISLIEPQPFEAVGLWYQDFGQTEDEEVQTILEKHAEKN